jgi:hypothetical protein
MATDKVIYTDGHDVLVTDTTFKVKNTSYRLNGITKLCMWTIRPDRWPSVLVLLLGLGSAVLGYLGYLPPEWVLTTDYGSFTANDIALWGGLALTIIGLLALSLSKERYAVRIATAEGEKNAVVSYKREYISQIVDALHSAFDLGSTDTRIITSKK